MGSRFYDSGGIINNGAAFIFDGSTTEIYAPDGEIDGCFGHSVSIHGDYAVIGALG